MIAELAVPALLSTRFYYCLFVLLLAGFAHGMFGFGFAMIATPLLAIFVDHRLAIILAALPLFFIAVRFLLANRRFVFTEGITRTMVPAVTVGSMFGAFFQSTLPAFAALALLGLLLAACAALPAYLNKRALKSSAVEGRRPAVLGVFAGVTEAALNVGAPFILLYGGIARLGRLQQLLALNLCFAVGKLVQILALVNVSSGTLPLQHLALAIAVAIAGQITGDRFAGRFSEASFRRIFSYFLWAMAAFMICRALLELNK